MRSGRHDPEGRRLPIKIEREAKMLGLNGAPQRKLERDRVQRSKLQYLNDPDPAFETYGPRTRREVHRVAPGGG